MNKKFFNKQNIVRMCLLLAVPGFIVIAAYLYRYSMVFSCPIKTYFHVLCPGCGMTRALAALFRLRFFQSVLFNPAAILLIAAGVCFYIEQVFLLFGKRIAILPRSKNVYIIVASIFIVYCVLRNIPAFAGISIA